MCIRDRRNSADRARAAGGSHRATVASATHQPRSPGLRGGRQQGYFASQRTQSTTVSGGHAIARRSRMRQALKLRAMPHTAHDGSVLLQAIVQSPHGMINDKDCPISSESLLSRSSDGTRRSGLALSISVAWLARCRCRDSKAGVSETLSDTRVPPSRDAGSSRCSTVIEYTSRYFPSGENEAPLFSESSRV